MVPKINLVLGGTRIARYLYLAKPSSVGDKTGLIFLQRTGREKTFEIERPPETSIRPIETT